MAAPDQIDELRHRFAVQPRRHFAPLADALRQSGAYEEAVTMLRAQLAELPDHLTGHVVLGQALFDAGALADARTAFETARALDPGNRVVLRQLGEIASLGGDQTTARLWFGRLRAADPYADDVEAQFGRGTPEPPNADEPSVVEDGARVAPEREIVEPAARESAAFDVEPPAIDPSAHFELLEFDPLPHGPPALDPVVGLDVAPRAVATQADEPRDAAADVLAAATHGAAEHHPSQHDFPDRDTPELDTPPELDQIASGPFATETMAGLLAAQGHTDQAVALYERLTAERPGDVALRARLDALRAPSPVDPTPTPPVAATPAPTPVAPFPATAPAAPGATPTSREDDAARAAMLAAGFASISRRDDASASQPVTADESDPYADLSFDRFFVPDVPEAAAPAEVLEPTSQADAPQDPNVDPDLARFDAWLREVAP